MLRYRNNIIVGESCRIYGTYILDVSRILSQK